MNVNDAYTILFRRFGLELPWLPGWVDVENPSPPSAADKEEIESGFPGGVSDGLVPMLQLRLVELPAVFGSRGIYGASKSYMPARALTMHPGMAEALVARETDYPGVFHMSDLCRSAASSLAAVEAGRGAQPPSRSQHNYGAAADDDLTGSKKDKREGNRDRLRAAGYVEFGRSDWKRTYDELNAGYRLYCFRRDGKLDSECWHYGFEVLRFALETDRTLQRATEHWIEHHYADYWENMTTQQVQYALKILGHNPGPVDGIVGDKTRTAVADFQAKWKLNKYKPRAKLGILDTNTRRTLAFIAADVHVMPWSEYKNQRT